MAINELYNVELEISETKNKLIRLEEKRKDILQENKLWEKRGKEPIPADKVEDEYAN